MTAITTLAALLWASVSTISFSLQPADGQHHYEPVLDDLSAYRLYPQQGLISNFIHDSAVTGIRELYRIGEDGWPMEYRRASVLHDEQRLGENPHQGDRLRATGAETVLRNRCGSLADEADYLESEQVAHLFYQGIGGCGEGRAEAVRGEIKFS